MVLICPPESVVVVEVAVTPEDCGSSTGGRPNLATTSARVVLCFSIQETSSGMIRLPCTSVAHPYRRKAMTKSIARRTTSLLRCDGPSVRILPVPRAHQFVSTTHDL